MDENLTNEPTDCASPIVVTSLSETVFAGNAVAAPKKTKPLSRTIPSWPSGTFGEGDFRKSGRIHEDKEANPRKKCHPVPMGATRSQRGGFPKWRLTLEIGLLPRGVNSQLTFIARLAVAGWPSIVDGARKFAERTHRRIAEKRDKPFGGIRLRSRIGQSRTRERTHAAHGRPAHSSAESPFKRPGQTDVLVHRSEGLNLCGRWASAKKWHQKGARDVLSRF
jgi:hypothetical protein